MNSEELRFFTHIQKVKPFLYFLAVANPELLTNKTPQFHKDIIQYYLQNDICVLAAPRSHAKTTITAFYLLWQMVTTETNFGIWISSTNTEATRIGQTIKESLENPYFVNLFNIQVISGSTQQLEFSVNGVKKAVRFDGIFGKLRGTNYLGQRPGIVAMDDVENDENVRSSDQRKKLQHIFNATILSLGDDKTQYILIGTVLHFDSLLRNQLKKREGLFFATTPDNPLWKDRFDSEWLLQKKKDIGSLVYAQEYENRPMLAEDAIFKEEYLQTGIEDGMDKMVLSIDPAISKKETSDNTGFLLVGMKAGKFYVLNDYSGKYSSVELVEKILTIYSPMRNYISGILIEEIAYQSAIKEWLLHEGGNRGQSIPVIQVRPDKDKQRRALEQVVHFENKRVYIAPGLNELRDELLQFPHGSHDDRVDALIYAIKFLNQPSAKVTTHTIPKSYENRW